MNLQVVPASPAPWIPKRNISVPVSPAHWIPKGNIPVPASLAPWIPRGNISVPASPDPWIPYGNIPALTSHWLQSWHTPNSPGWWRGRFISEGTFYQDYWGAALSCVLPLGQHQHQGTAKGSCSQENTFSRQCTFVEASQLRASHSKKAPSPWCTVRQLTDNYRLISRRNMALVKGIISILSFLVNTWWELQHIYDSSKRQNPPAPPQLYFA